VSTSSRRVLVAGCGLIGTSIALALRQRGHRVWLSDMNDAHLRQAEQQGAGDAHRGEHADIVVVAVPPSSTAEVIAAHLNQDEDATVTDTASIKAHVQRDIEQLAAAEQPPPDTARYVGGHPLAGRERGGPQRARADLFAGRAWALTPTPATRPAALKDARWLVHECGATPVIIDAVDHDQALALTSHVPQLVASALAAQLADQPDDILELVGQGLRDMTRIAAADSALWADIASGNAQPLADATDALAGTLQRTASALRDGTGAAAVAHLVDAGRAGLRRLPGKHGGEARSFIAVSVVVRDQPGEFARLLTDTAAAAVNVEDLRVEHAPGLPMGLIEVFVGPEAAATLRAALASRGWTLIDDEPVSEE